LPEASRFAQLEEIDWAFEVWEHRIKPSIWLPYILKISPILSWNADDNLVSATGMQSD
jgi:hypothetical protein